MMMNIKQSMILSLRNLSTIAFFGSIIVTATGFIVRNDLQKKIRKTITYKKALKIFYDHKKTIEYLGKPITEGKITLPKYVAENIKTFSVNVKGANTAGKLHFMYQIQPDERTEIKKVEIKFNDIPDKTFVIHEI